MEFKSINELGTFPAILLAVFGRIKQYVHPIEEGKLQRVTGYYQWKGEKYRIGEYLRKPEQ